MVCRAHHEPEPAPASDPRAGAEFSDFGVPVVVTEEPVVFKTVVLYLAKIRSHVDHPGAGDPAPGSVGEGVVVEGEIWLVCTGVVVVGYCERLWIGREEGERRIERCGEEGDSRGWLARNRGGVGMTDPLWFSYRMAQRYTSLSSGGWGRRASSMCMSSAGWSSGRVLVEMVEVRDGKEGKRGKGDF